MGGALLLSGLALINIPTNAPLIVYLQADPCRPRATILSVFKPQIFFSSKDGRATHASVIQHHCQRHFEDSYPQAGKQSDGSPCSEETRTLFLSIKDA